eukprot:5608557-Pleurochrysis_carterae.AAC.3
MIESLLTYRTTPSIGLYIDTAVRTETVYSEAISHMHFPYRRFGIISPVSHEKTHGGASASDCWRGRRHPCAALLDGAAPEAKRRAGRLERRLGRPVWIDF